MKCEECQILIEESVDGALDRQAALLVESHTASCAECANFYSEVSREQEIYARYQREIEVTPLMWSTIESRIKQDRLAERSWFVRMSEKLSGVFAAPRLSPGFAAALVIIAVGVTVGVMTLLNSRNVSQIPGQNPQPGATVAETEKSGDNPAAPAPIKTDEGKQVADRNAAPGVKVTGNERSVRPAPGQKLVAANQKVSPEQLVKDAEQKYLTAIAMLSRDVNKHRSQLDPIMLARFDAALGDIDRTIKDTRKVVHDNPGDPVALQYLLAAYSKKVDVLREMTMTEN